MADRGARQLEGALRVAGELVASHLQDQTHPSHLSGVCEMCHMCAFLEKTCEMQKCTICLQANASRVAACVFVCNYIFVAFGALKGRVYFSKTHSLTVGPLTSLCF